MLSVFLNASEVVDLRYINQSTVMNNQLDSCVSRRPTDCPDLWSRGDKEF